MAKRCSITNKAAQWGNKVSHSNRKKHRKFNPNLQNSSFYSDALGRTIQLSVPASTIRSVDHNGGIDAYLLSTSNLKLTEEAKRLKKLIKQHSAKAA